MSKAFTRESDDAVEAPISRPAPSLLPPGVKNHITPDGARRLREELTRLEQMERPRLSGATDDDEARRQLHLLDQRILRLSQGLQSTVVTPPPATAEERAKARFGATVVVREPDGGETRYRIVGVDEADPDRGEVSWLSPLARALLNRKAGDRVRFKTPAGEVELELIAVGYQNE